MRLLPFASRVAEDFTVTTANGPVGWDALVAALDFSRQSIPDLRYTPLMVIAEGSRVVVRYEFTGTFTSPMIWMTGSVIPATGETVRVHGHVLLTFTDNGLLLNYTEVLDNLNLLAELGVFLPGAPLSVPLSPIDAEIWTITETSAAFTEDLRQRVLTTASTVYGTGDLRALDRLYAQDVVTYPGLGDLDAIRANVTALRLALSSFTVDVDTVIVEGNWVAYHWRASGIFTGSLSLFGLAFTPTNRLISYEGISLGYANPDGLIAAEWTEIDNLSLATQFGLLPPL